MAYLILALALVLGSSSLFVFAVFAYFGPFGLVNLKFGAPAILFFNACLSLMFFIQHSWMVRKSFRNQLARHVDPQYHGPIFAISSGIVLLAVMVLWQESLYMVASLQGAARLLIRSLFFISIVGFAWGFLTLGELDVFGICEALERMRKKNRKKTDLLVRGPYKWVRHPLYACCLLMIWSSPDITGDRLLFNVLWTIWIIIGARLEERELVAEFGNVYRDYQKKVSMLVPGIGAFFGSRRLSQW